MYAPRALTRNADGASFVSLRTRDLCNCVTTAWPRRAASVGVAMSDTSIGFGLWLRLFGRVVIPAIIGVFVLLFGATQPAAAGLLRLAQNAAGTLSLDSYAPAATNPALGDSQHGLGGNPSGGMAGGNPCASNMSDHCGQSGGSAGAANSNPCASNMSDHCGNSGNSANSASNDPCASNMSDHCGNAGTADNNPCASNMSDHCGNKGGGPTTADNKSVTATALIAPPSGVVPTMGQPGTLGGKPPIPLDKPIASGPPLAITPQR